jgi:hypothetical protein
VKPVDQTKFGVPGGNCFSACVASLLSVPVDDVPYFMGEKDWLRPLADWLQPRGFYPIFFNLGPHVGDWRPQGLYVLGGESARGPHAVVARGDEVVHDPHPSRTGLLTHEDATIIVPLDLTPPPIL